MFYVRGCVGGKLSSVGPTDGGQDSVDTGKIQHNNSLRLMVAAAETSPLICFDELLFARFPSGFSSIREKSQSEIVKFCLRLMANQAAPAAA